MHPRTIIFTAYVVASFLILLACWYSYYFRDCIVVQNDLPEPSSKLEFITSFVGSLFCGAGIASFGLYFLLAKMYRFNFKNHCGGPALSLAAIFGGAMLLEESRWCELAKDPSTVTSVITMPILDRTVSHGRNYDFPATLLLPITPKRHWFGLPRYDGLENRLAQNVDLYLPVDEDTFRDETQTRAEVALGDLHNGKVKYLKIVNRSKSD